MVRKNIFQQIGSSINFYSEIQRLDELLFDEKGVRLEIRPDPISAYYKKHFEFYSIEKFVDKFSFKKWKSRGTCIDCSDMRERLSIPTILDKVNLSQDEVLTYLEYVANILMLIGEASFKEGCDYYETDVCRAAKQNLCTILDWLNCEEKQTENEKKILIVEKNAAATAVAEVVVDSLAYKIVQYNHFSLKGDISTKKTILLSLGSELEPRRKDLSRINKQFTDNIFFLLNNINIRHNNRSKSSKYYKEYVAKLSYKQLEKWYDELYQMCLLAFLELDQVDRSARVDALKVNIETTQNK